MKEIEKIKQLFKSKLALFGYEITRTKNKRTTLAAVLYHISQFGFKPETIIDVGVAYGTFELYAIFPKAQILLIEPLKEWENVLKKICNKYNGEYIIAAAGAKSEKIIINVQKDLASSSIFKPVGVKTKMEPREIQAIRIDDICGRGNFKQPYLIKVDVEGAELYVMDGAQESMKNAEVIILEVRLFQSRENQPQFYDVINYMKKRGWVVYDIFHYGKRPSDNALSIVDIAFVKEGGLFRKHHSWR